MESMEEEVVVIEWMGSEQVVSELSLASAVRLRQARTTSAKASLSLFLCRGDSYIEEPRQLINHQGY